MRAGLEKWTSILLSDLQQRPVVDNATLLTRENNSDPIRMEHLSRGQKNTEQHDLIELKIEDVSTGDSGKRVFCTLFVYVYTELNKSFTIKAQKSTGNYKKIKGTNVMPPRIPISLILCRVYQ